VLRVFGWLALLAWSDRAKDAEIRAPRTQLEDAMQTIVSMCRSAWLPRSQMPNLPALAQEKRPGQRHDGISGTHTVLAGTDAAGAGCLADEIALLASLGMSPADALAAGSSAARAYLGRPGFVPGAPADLVTYHDDPRNDPGILKQPAAIIRRGIRIK
jgi:hypothetical protein